MEIINVQPYFYIHIRNKTENTTKLIEGPIRYTVSNDEELVKGPEAMIKLLPNTFIRIKDPIWIEDGQVQMEEKFNQVKLRFGEEEIRSYKDYHNPFSLYPGEIQISEVKQAKILNENEALRLVALRSFTDKDSIERIAGNEWIVRGPTIFIDQIEAQVVEEIKAIIIDKTSALRLKAKRDFTDQEKNKRISGQEWLVRKTGPYIPEAEEIIVGLVKAETITDTKAIKVKALSKFVDFYGKERKPGEEWVITNETASYHIPDVYETITERLNKIVLNKWQYCIILDPVEKGKNLFGQKVLKKGPNSFFLSPGEKLKDNNIFNAKILGDDEAILLQAKVQYKDEYGNHPPGERWMVYGPRFYIPDIDVEELEIRKSIPLNDSEGIYVRDIHSGLVRMVTGQTYLLKAHEEFWELNLSDDVERLLQSESGCFWPEKDSKNPLKIRDKTKVVTFQVPHNSVVQVFDYKTKKNRLVFGPDLIKLSPYEQFTVLSLSGGVPKREDQVKTIVMRLGPDYNSDSIEVETSDHARLKMKLTYSWKFDFDINDEQQTFKLFQVKDFIGDYCKSIASRIRGIVSSVTFDSFHKDSSNIVQTGVFGKDSTGRFKKPLRFKSNNLIITNVDIQSQEPVDSKMRKILNESMKLSMETNLKIQEAEAKHRENQANQEAKGKIMEKKLKDETTAEERRLELLKIVAEDESIRVTGLSDASAQAKAKELEINSAKELETAKLEFEAKKKMRIVELEFKKLLWEKELEHNKKVAQLEIDRAQALCDSEIKKIETMVNSIGKDTLVALARAGPESQVKILKSLGIQSLLVTDGKSPVNLFNTASGLVGPMPFLSGGQN